jgi:hypothetical protein
VLTNFSILNCCVQAKALIDLFPLGEVQISDPQSDPQNVCHGRGRGFEARRPGTFQCTYTEWAETAEGAKGHSFVSLLCPLSIKVS